MDRDDLASLAGFFAGAEPMVPGGTIRLGTEAAHHMRVRRLAVGDRVYVADGAGAQGVGCILRLGKNDADVRVDDVARFGRAAATHLLVPIADRDRMLWLAEKCAELEATSWRPVLWQRSRSVSPRGEGASFATRVHARMTSALVQSHAPWLPDVHADASLQPALASLPDGGTRLVLDASGEPIAAAAIAGLAAPVTVAVGPEGGLEPGELGVLADAGFRAVSLGANVLRFETAAVAALAIVRGVLAATALPPETIDG